MSLLSKLFPNVTRAKNVIDESLAATQALKHSLEKLDATVLRYVSQEDECCPPQDQRRRLTDQYAKAISNVHDREEDS